MNGLSVTRKRLLICGPVSVQFGSFRYVLGFTEEAKKGF